MYLYVERNEGAENTPGDSSRTSAFSWIVTLGSSRPDNAIFGKPEQARAYAGGVIDYNGSTAELGAKRTARRAEEVSHDRASCIVEPGMEKSIGCECTLT